MRENTLPGPQARAPIASNTSAIPITQLQAPRRRPERFVGMHWAEPAHATRFLEIIRGEHTSSETFAATAALAARLGKEPCLVKRDVPGRWVATWADRP